MLCLHIAEQPTFFTEKSRVSQQKVQQLRRKTIILLLSNVVLAAVLNIWWFTHSGIEDPITSALLFCLPLGLFVRIGLTYGERVTDAERQLAKHRFLTFFFETISDDLHPDTPLKGFLNCATRPRSVLPGGVVKIRWAHLKFRLLDGSYVRLSCDDKYIYKEGIAVFLGALAKQKIWLNPLLKTIPQASEQVIAMELGGAFDLNLHPKNYAQKLVCAMKTKYRDAAS